jgi:hypothetical protein
VGVVAPFFVRVIKLRRGPGAEAGAVPPQDARLTTASTPVGAVTASMLAMIDVKLTVVAPPFGFHASSSAADG